MGFGIKWTDDEVRKLKENYPGRGMYWDGWGQVLPGRTAYSIRKKAEKVGVHVFRDPRRNDPVKALLASSVDPFERYVVERMSVGLTPTEIDRERKWWPGKSVMIITGLWERGEE